MRLESAILLQHLSVGGRCLDAGCANGYATFKLLSGNSDDLVAIDFSRTMIQHARQSQIAEDPKGKSPSDMGTSLTLRCQMKGSTTPTQFAF